MTNPATVVVQCRRPIFLSVVIPAYNEEAEIEQVIMEHVEVLRTLAGVIAGWEIVCVDDASYDRTQSILDGLSARLTGLRVIRHRENSGIYRSFADGFAAAQGTHIYATGADGQWPATNLVAMVRAVVSGVDLVVGVRLNRSQVYGLKRRFVSFAFNLSSRALFGVKTVDAGSVKLGMRDLFRLELISRSPYVEAERILKAQRCGYCVDFVPVEFRVRGGGKATGARWSTVLASARDCLRCAKVYGLRRSRPC
jgi:glycosyltransferase involved in cell wall biosynthesis